MTTRILRIYHSTGLVDEIPFLSCNAAQAFTSRALSGCRFEYGFLDLNEKWITINSWANPAADSRECTVC